ncbi:MAG: ATP-binding cassette domain-containing protein [Immundisolibacteraceae bacterium]|nr:ATP-binding cassette domain-containing protein [Immundisolibacteraceae bacterium]
MIPLLSLNQVAVISATGNQLLADVDLSIDPKQIVSIIGPDGAGKSTLIRVMAGLQNTTSGIVERQPDLRLGYVPQQLTIPKNLPLTTQQFLQLNRPAKNQPMETTNSKNPDPLAINALRSRPLQALSGGEMRRVLLARALAGSPQLLLLDEPTAGVDLIGQVEFYQLLASIRDQYNCAIVIVSHDLHFVMSATDRVLCLDQGLVCCHGAPEEVSEHPEYQALFGEGTEKAFAVFSHAMGGHQHAHVHSHAHGDDHIEAGESVHG